MRNIFLILILGTHLLFCSLPAFAQDSRVPAPAIRSTFQDPAVPMIALPTRFTSHRVSCYKTSVKDSIDLANLEGPGCVRHIWILWPGIKPKDGKVVRLEINVDGAEKSQVDVPLKAFFGIMHGRDPYFVDCAAYTVLPNLVTAKLWNVPSTPPGYNLWLPIPFSKSCRITIHNPVKNTQVSMVDWHKYDKDTILTPYRLHADYRIYKPSPSRVSYVELANIEGEGFVAGVVIGHIHRNKRDLVFHTGGMAILLDGETDPHAIRGHNLEDDFGFSQGFNDVQSQWIGCPWYENRGTHDHDGVFYRFFGPDPIAFDTSLSFRTGSRGDDMESVVYIYRIPNTTAPKTQSPSEWKVMTLSAPRGKVATMIKVGNAAEWDFTPSPPPETEWQPFKNSQYIPAEQAEQDPSLPADSDSRKVAVTTLKSDHGWIDLRTMGPYSAIHCPHKVNCVYARTSIQSDTDRSATLRLAVSDWAVVWLNGEKIATLRHDEGLKVARIAITLKKGSNELLVKSNNMSRFHWTRTWLINCVVE